MTPPVGRIELDRPVVERPAVACLVTLLSFTPREGALICALSIILVQRVH